MVKGGQQASPYMSREVMEALEVLVEAVDSAAMVEADDHMVGRQVDQHS